jgi:hypothetical protein
MRPVFFRGLPGCTFALTFAAVMFGLWLPASLALGAVMEDAYPVIAWLCGATNLVCVDLLLRQPQRAIAAAAHYKPFKRPVTADRRR